MLEQGLRDRLTVAPLPAASQRAEQGPHADRLQAQITQDTGDLGLRGRLDQTRQNHLLKGPIARGRPTQPRTGVGVAQDLPQQGPLVVDQSSASAMTGGTEAARPAGRSEASRPTARVVANMQISAR